MLRQSLSEWIRWKIALLLDRRRDTCWAELVSWALDSGCPFMEFRRCIGLAGRCARLGGDYGYCRKCEITGLHQEILFGIRQAEMRANIAIAKAARGSKERNGKQARPGTA